MQRQGLSFRATKDLDVVLVVEALTPAFAAAFWRFIEAGGYQRRERGDGAPPQCHRFSKPTDASFPWMIELFARAPGITAMHDGDRLTRLRFDGHAASLSAILLDHDYYTFILSGRREVDGLTMIAEDRLIPLKAIAWMELEARRRAGLAVDGRDVRKHLHDVLRLAGLFTPDTHITTMGRVRDDMRTFVEVMSSSGFDPAAAGLGPTPLGTLLDRLRRAYVL